MVHHSGYYNNLIDFLPSYGPVIEYFLISSAKERIEKLPKILSYK